MTMKKKKKTKYQKKTHAVLDVCLVALYLAVDPALQGVDEVVQRVVGGGVERGLVEVVVGGFFFGAGRRGRGRGRRRRGGREEASVACRANRLFRSQCCHLFSTSRVIG